MIVRRGGVLAIEAPISTYVIEPLRHGLGLTCVGMVDDHLARLIVDRRQHGADSDALLDARMVFALEEIAVGAR